MEERRKVLDSVGVIEIRRKLIRKILSTVRENDKNSHLDILLFWPYVQKCARNA